MPAVRRRPAYPLSDPRPVFELPGVPVEQAIVLADGRGRGSVLLAINEPDGGWDPDLTP